MSKWQVTAAVPVFITVEVEAEDEEEAIDAAFNEGLGDLQSYVGNGGYEKLVGVSGDNIRIEPGTEVIEEGSFSFKIEAVEVKIKEGEGK